MRDSRLTAAQRISASVEVQSYYLQRSAQSARSAKELRKAQKIHTFQTAITNANRRRGLLLQHNEIVDLTSLDYDMGDGDDTTHEDDEFVSDDEEDEKDDQYHMHIFLHSNKSRRLNENRSLANITSSINSTASSIFPPHASRLPPRPAAKKPRSNPSRLVGIPVHNPVFAPDPCESYRSLSTRASASPASSCTTDLAASLRSAPSRQQLRSISTRANHSTSVQSDTSPIPRSVNSSLSTRTRPTQTSVPQCPAFDRPMGLQRTFGNAPWPSMAFDESHRLAAPRRRAVPSGRTGDVARARRRVVSGRPVGTLEKSRVEMARRGVVDLTPVSPPKMESISLEDDSDEDDEVVIVETKENRAPRIIQNVKCVEKRRRDDSKLNMEKKKDDIRFRALSDEEYEEVYKMTYNVRKKQQLVFVMDAGIQLCGEDLSCLRGCRWLNDEIINSVAGLINARNMRAMCDGDMNEVVEVSLCSSLQSEKGVGKSGNKLYERHFQQKRGRVHVFNSFFFTRLTQGGYDYNGVRRWLQRARKDVCSLDMIMFPINVDNLHWVLAVVDMRNRHLVYLDSLLGGDERGMTLLLRRWVEDEVRDKHGERKAKELDIGNWTVFENPEYLPRQEDGGSCGIFSMYMADYLERGRCPDFTQDDVRVLRRRTVLFLRNGRMPD